MGTPGFKVYLADGREYFEYGKSQPVRRDAPFLDSLLALLYLDTPALEPVFKKIDRALQNLYTTHDPQYAGRVRAALDELAEKHIYFQLLRLDLRARLKRAEAQNYMDTAGLPSRKQLSRIPSEIDALQRQLEPLFSAVLDAGAGGGPALQRLAEYCQSAPPSLLFQFRPLETSFELVEPGLFTEVLYPKDFYDLVEFFLRECIRCGQRVRRCKNCGRYFALTGRASAEYCGRTFDEKGRTCKDIGAIKLWTQKRREDEVFQIYRREYKRRFAWIRAGRIQPEEFYAWSAKARAQKSACDSGSISLEEFQSWLKTSD